MKNLKKNFKNLFLQLIDFTSPAKHTEDIGVAPPWDGKWLTPRNTPLRTCAVPNLVVLGERV